MRCPRAFNRNASANWHISTHQQVENSATRRISLSLAEIKKEAAISASRE
jgi:hypothetical protein